MRIIYYTIEHTRALVREFFKEWLTFKFVEISIGKFSAYELRNSHSAQKCFKNVASALDFTLCERFWNAIFGKFI